MSDAQPAIKVLDKKVRVFVLRAQKKRKKGHCKQCARLRRELSPIISMLTNLVLMGDVAVEQERIAESRAAVNEWMAAQLKS